MKKNYPTLIIPHFLLKNKLVRFGFGFLLLMFNSNFIFGQILWTNAGASTAWYTGTNWTPNTIAAAWLTTDVALFNNSGTATTAGINMNTASLSIATIEVSNARTRALTIGNSSTIVNGILTLNAGTINAINNVILRNNSNSPLTIQDFQGTNSGQTMNLALANATDNIVNIDGTGGIAISSIISGAGRNLTLAGVGTGILSLTAADTYTGLTTITANTLQLNRTGGGTLPNANNILINGTGTLRISTDQTISNLTMASGTLLIDAGATLTVTGAYNVTGGIINNQGTIKLNGGAVSFPGTGVTVNNGTANTMTNLEIAASGNITQTLSFAISNALTFTSGKLTTGTNTLTITNTTASAIIGANATKYIITNGATGGLQRTVTAATNTYSFPVGSNTDYQLVTIDFTSAPTTPGSLTTRFSTAYAGWPNIGPLTEGAINLNKVSLIGSWFVDATGGLAGGNYTGIFAGNGVTDDLNLALLVLVKRPSAGGDWTTSNGIHVTTIGTITQPVLSRTGMSGFSEFAIGGELSVSLPVAFNYLNGTKQNSGNYLNWKVTCTNNPNVTMSLERSADKINFTSITSITADALRCQQPFDYTDNSPAAGLNYYRLKMTDANGKTTYSGAIAILNKAIGFDFVSLMPSVVNSTAVLNITSAQKIKMDVVITDIAGKQVQKIAYNLIAGSNQFKLNLANLGAGTYQITGYTADGEPKTLRFVKQ